MMSVGQLQFTDDQIAEVLAVAAKLQPQARPLLLRWLAHTLPGGEVGDDALRAALAEITTGGSVSRSTRASETVQQEAFQHA